MTVDITTFIYSPIYIIGHWVGLIVATVVQMFSGVVLPNTIIDTVGLLTIATILLTLAEIAKKIAWGIVTICWALVIIRIGMLTYTSAQ